MTRYLAVFKKEKAELILLGKKSLEIRFSKSKIAPFGVISSGDLVYIKPSGEDIIGQFRVKKVIFFDGLRKEDILDFKKSYTNRLAVDENYWVGKETYKFASLIFIGDCNRFITSPIKSPKKRLSSWLKLD